MFSSLRTPLPASAFVHGNNHCSRSGHAVLLWPTFYLHIHISDLLKLLENKAQKKAAPFSLHPDLSRLHRALRLRQHLQAAARSLARTARPPFVCSIIQLTARADKDSTTCFLAHGAEWACEWSFAASSMQLLREMPSFRWEYWKHLWDYSNPQILSLSLSLYIYIYTNKYNKWCSSNCLPHQCPASPLSIRREKDEFPLPSELLLDVIWYGISLWPV